ncbi:MAG: YfiR family protein [Myxococcales bacterium]|nr:YfiR family protein [Myxococcales bacterium]
MPKTAPPSQTRGDARATPGPRVWLLAAVVGLCSLASPAAADDATVPVGAPMDVPMRVPMVAQAALLVKVAPYDRNYAERVDGRVVTLVVVKPDDVESTHCAAELTSLLGKRHDVSGLPHDELVVNYSGPVALADASRLKRAAMVYLCPGLAVDLPSIANALDGISVLSVGAVPEYAPLGAVLAFELASGKPRILLNLRQARKQHVAFDPDAIEVMKLLR